MTAQSLCEAGEQYACELLKALSGDTPQAIAIAIAACGLIAAWLIWDVTKH